jgi:hypothetical protein
MSPGEMINFSWVVVFLEHLNKYLLLTENPVSNTTGLCICVITVGNQTACIVSL